MATMAAKPPTKLRWGELDEDDEAGDLAYLLPPRQVVGPDHNGIKKVIEYKFNEDGNKVKVTTTARVQKLAEARLSKHAMERRGWGKFGDAVDEDVGARLTMVSTEEIALERPRGSKAEETIDRKDPPNAPTPLILCRICGKKGDHWSARCPYKDLTTQVDNNITTPTSEKPESTKSVYVPPNIRSGERPAGSEMRRRNEENSVRVTNLSEDTREPDLLELFRTFGQVSRVYVAMDQRTGTSRGFGFVNFVNKNEAENAIAKLNGYGYDNLILRVEWAAPRTNQRK